MIPTKKIIVIVTLSVSLERRRDNGKQGGRAKIFHCKKLFIFTRIDSIANKDYIVVVLTKYLLNGWLNFFTWENPSNNEKWANKIWASIPCLSRKANWINCNLFIYFIQTDWLTDVWCITACKASFLYFYRTGEIFAIKMQSNMYDEEDDDDDAC